MPNDADRAGTPAGVFGAELRFYRTRAGLSQKDLAAKATVSHDVISKIETGERPPAEDFPPRLDAVPELDTRGALTRLWDHLKKGQKQRLYGWFQQWADIEAQATVLRWYEPLVVPGLLQTEEYARAILSARPDGNLDDLDEQVAARLARQAILDRTGAPQLWCILDEGVLHRAIGGSKVMRSQLYRLAEVARAPQDHHQVSLHVTASAIAATGLSGHSYRARPKMTGIDLQDEIEAKLAKNEACVYHPCRTASSPRATTMAASLRYPSRVRPSDLTRLGRRIRGRFGWRIRRARHACGPLPTPRLPSSCRGPWQGP